MAKEYTVTQSELDSVANKIREKTSTTDKIVFPEGFELGVEAAYTAGRKSLLGFIEGLNVEITKEDLKGVTKIRPYFCYSASVTSVDIPETVKNIGSSAFRECLNLTRINIPDSVVGAGDRVFYHCTSLQGSLYLGNIESINAHFCNGCTGLTEVIFGKGLKKINSYAFGSCVNIKTFDLTACESVPTLVDITAFNNIPDFTVLVKSSLLNEFRNASVWSSISNQIKSQ